MNEANFIPTDSRFNYGRYKYYERLNWIINDLKRPVNECFKSNRVFHLKWITLMNYKAIDEEMYNVVNN